MEGAEKEIWTNSRFSQLPHGREPNQLKQDGGSTRLCRLVEADVLRIEVPADNASRHAAVYSYRPHSTLPVTTNSTKEQE